MLFGVKYVTLATLQNKKNRTLIIYKKNYLECVNTGRDNTKFTSGKYHINTMEIIKLFLVNIFMPVTKFPDLTIFAKRGHFRSLVSSWDFSQKPAAKFGDFAVRKKGRQKTRMAKRGQKSVTKKREFIFNFKILKYE